TRVDKRDARERLAVIEDRSARGREQDARPDHRLRDLVGARGGFGPIGGLAAQEAVDVDHGHRPEADHESGKQYEKSDKYDHVNAFIIRFSKTKHIGTFMFVIPASRHIPQEPQAHYSPTPRQDS